MRVAFVVLMILSLAGTAQAFTYRPEANVWRADDPVPSAAMTGGALGGERTSWTFGANVRVSQGGQQVWQDIVRFGGGRLCAAWMDDRTGTYKIYSSVSTDGGTTWLTDQRVDDSPAGAMARFVTLSPIGLFDVVAVWEDSRSSGGVDNVYFSRGVWNAGSSRLDWSPSVRVNTAGGTNDVSNYMHPSVAVGYGRVHVAWSDWREGPFFQVYSRTSTDEGLTWGPEIRISDEIGYQPVAGDPSLVIDGSSGGNPMPVLCAWNDWRGNAPGGRYPNVYFARSTDGGLTWTNPNVMVNDVTDGYQQVSKHVVAIAPSRVIAVGWYNDDYVGQPDMRVSRSTNLGATWGASARVSDPVIGCDVAVALDLGIDNDILTSWSGYTTDWNAYFRGSDDAGATWSPILRVDDDASGGRSGSPNIATLPDGSPMIVLQDTRPGYGPYGTWVAPGHRAGNSSVEDGGRFADAGTLVTAPIPASDGQAVIHWSIPGARDARMCVADAAGRLVFERQVLATGEMSFRSTLPAGTYFVTVGDGVRSRRGRLILIR